MKVSAVMARVFQWNKTMERENELFLLPTDFLHWAIFLHLFGNWTAVIVPDANGRRLAFSLSFRLVDQNKQANNESSQVCLVHEAPHTDDFIGCKSLVNFTRPTNFDEFDLESDDMVRLVRTFSFEMWRHFQFLIFNF